MKRDHLVPKVVIAANGNPVTRWVRPETQGAFEPFPSPSPVQKQEAELPLRTAKSELANMMAEVHVDEFDDWGGEDQGSLYTRLKARLDSYPPDTVYGLYEMFLDREDSRKLLLDVVNNRHGDEFVQDLLHCYDALAAVSDDPSSEDYSPTFYGVAFYPQVVPYEPGNYPEERKRQIDALITVTDGMERLMMTGELRMNAVEYVTAKEAGRDAAVIRNKGIADLVLERPDDAHRIVDLLNERGLDVDSIRVALELEVASLSKGAL